MEGRRSIGLARRRDRVKLMTDGVLMASVHELRLSEAAVATDTDLARAAFAACVVIEQRSVTEEQRIAALAADADLDVAIERPRHRRQNHAITARVASFDDADRLADVLASDGYERWERWTGGARESFRRTATMLSVGKTTDVTMVVRIRWADPIRRSTLQRAFVPTSGDWHIVDLPRWAWPIYSVIRPIRQVAERIGLRRRHEASLGPFLSTPDGLLPALFAFAKLATTDVIIDLGCGDGRIAVAAAEQVGCTARGVESDPELVARARRRVEASPAAGLLEIVAGDARTVDLADVSVAFVFLPVDVVADLLPKLLESLPAGARLVMHEQSALPARLQPAPEHSELLVSSAGVTVAHRWTVR